MTVQRPVTILCLASYFKGEEFLRECRRLGCRTLLLTVEELGDADWPRDAIDELYRMPDLYDRQAVLDGVSWLMRGEAIERIVPLDEFDAEMAATLREHLRVPGPGETAARAFRDKLVMRERAGRAGVLQPDHVGVLNHDRLRAFMAEVPPPWILKPRTQASAVGLKKIHEPEQLWRTLDALGDRQSHHVLERFVPGDVYHVDGAVYDGELRFAEAHRYATPPFDVMHGGGLFASRTLPRGSDEERELERIGRQLIASLGLEHGVMHTEFIRGREDGRFYFVEAASRVGGAHIAEMVEAATGVNLWREWARLEAASARGEDYRVEPEREHYGGVLISLARQEWPDLSGYAEPEVAWRMHKRHHAGLIVASPDAGRVESLLEEYMRRFRDDFFASLPAPDRPTS